MNFKETPLCATNGAHTASRGLLIVLEGLDRSGKTTQANRLVNYLNGLNKRARLQRFPDRDEPMFGPAIDRFLKNAKTVEESREAVHLMFSANRWLLAQKMRDELSSGTHLIVDRYSFSGIAYSMAKGLEKRWVCASELGLPKPDLVLYFDATPDEVAERPGFGEEALERSDFQRLVYANMNSLFDKTYWQSITAIAPEASVQASIASIVDEWLKRSLTQSIPNFAFTDFNLNDAGASDQKF